MRILVVGAGGVGSAVAAIARRRAFFERMVLADLSSERSRATVARLGDERFASAQSTPQTRTRSSRWRRPSAPTRSSTPAIPG